MKRFHFMLLLTLLLAACQTATVTSVPTASTPIAATATRASISKSTSTPTLTPTPTGPAVHSSSSNPNAANLIVVKDQLIVNSSLTLDSVTAAQAGWIVLYLDKTPPNARHVVFGPKIVFAPVPSGKSNHFVISFSQNVNPSIDLSSLPGINVDAVLQTGASGPSAMVQDNGSTVWVTFKILTNNKSALFPTATP